MGLTVKAGFGHDLQEVRADLEAVEVGLGRLVGEVGKKRLTPVIAEVRGLLPLDPQHRGWEGHDESWKAKNDPGHIRDSVKGGSTASGYTIYTNHPGAPVHWWAGHIAPKGTEIEIRKDPGAGKDFWSREAESAGRAIERDLDSLLRRHRL